jgi:hypothetical protein
VPKPSTGIAWPVLRVTRGIDAGAPAIGEELVVGGGAPRWRSGEELDGSGAVTGGDN